MPVSRGGGNIGKSYVGSTPILREYVGDKLIFDAGSVVVPPEEAAFRYWRIIRVSGGDPANPATIRAARIQFRETAGASVAHLSSGTSNHPQALGNWPVPTNAFVNSTLYYSDSNGETEWIGWDWLEATIIEEVYFYSNHATARLVNFDIEASHDAVTWVTKAQVRGASGDPVTALVAVPSPVLEGFSAVKVTASGVKDTPIADYGAPNWNPQNNFDPATGEWVCGKTGLYWIGGAGFPQGGMSGGGGSGEWQIRMMRNGVLENDGQHRFRQYSSSRSHGGYGFTNSIMQIAVGDVMAIQHQNDIAENVYFSAYEITTDVAFHAYKAVASGVDGDVITGHIEVFDIGNNFDPATGAFVAPVDGYYLVTMQAFPNGGITGTNTQVRVWPYIDGVESGIRNYYEIGSSTDGRGNTLGHTILLFLTAGQSLTYRQHLRPAETVVFSAARIEPSIAFAARKNVATGANGEVIAAYDGKDFDLGNNFDIATGVFTVPEDGQYHFMGFSHGVASSSEVQTQLFVNGIRFIIGRSYLAQIAHRASPVVSIVANLVAGDVVGITQNNSGTDVFFAGYKLG